MELKTCESKLVAFLSNNNTLVIKDKKEYDTFRKTMNTVGISTKVLDKIAINKFYKLVVEYNNYKGFTYWNMTGTLELAIEESTKWFYEKPITVEEIKLI